MTKYVRVYDVEVDLVPGGLATPTTSIVHYVTAYKLAVYQRWYGRTALRVIGCRGQLAVLRDDEEEFQALMAELSLPIQPEIYQDGFKSVYPYGAQDMDTVAAKIATEYADVPVLPPFQTEPKFSFQSEDLQSVQQRVVPLTNDTPEKGKLKL